MSERWSRGALAVAGLGLALLAGFAANLAWELRTLAVALPPVLVFLLGATLSGGLMYAGRRLVRSELDPAGTRRVAAWSGAGAATLAAVTLVTQAVRALEGRPLGEPQLPLLVSAAAGGLAGAVAGHRTVLARQRSREAERARETLAFLNRTLRHEVLNGVNLVAGHATNLRDDLGDDPSVDTIEETAAELAELIDDVSEVADAHAGRAELEPVDVAALLADGADWLADSHPGATVEVDLPDRATVAATDALDHALRNLLANAAEHAGDEPTVEVAAEVDGDAVEVRVADDGPGIPDDRKAAVLEPTDEGTHGFGLYLARTLVEGYGGSLAVEDNEPTGTVLIVRLPCERAADGGRRDGAGERDGRRPVPARSTNP